MENRVYKIELTDNAVKNMMSTYVEHKKMMNEYEDENDTENIEYAFHRGCCETAENWLRLISISPQCNYIMDRLYTE